MPVTVIVEDGTIVTDANSYVDPTAAVATDYFAAHLWATAWTAATADQKAGAVIMATRYIDDLITWKGNRVESTQPRAWPRENIYLNGDWLADDAIPLDIQHAVLETALAFLTGNRVSDTAKSAGVSSIALGNGALGLEFNQPDPTRNLPIIPNQVMMSLLKYGGSIEGGFRQIPVSR